MASEATERLKAKYPDLEIVGVHHGYFQKEGKENERVISEINRLKPHILLVCFGMPVQGEWIRDSWKRLEVKHLPERRRL